MNHSGIRYCFQLWKAKESIVFFVLLSYLSIPGALYAATGANARSTVNPNDMNLNTPPAIAGNIPQDVTERAARTPSLSCTDSKKRPGRQTGKRFVRQLLGHDPQHTQPIPRHAVQLYDGIRGRRMEPSFPGTAETAGTRNVPRDQRRQAYGGFHARRPVFPHPGAGRWAFVSNSLPSSTKS